MYRRGYLLTLPLLLSTGAAVAQPPDTEAEAAELFRQGLAAVEAKDCQRAITLFERSRALSPRSATLYNIASCEEQLGLVAAALNHFQKVALDLAPSDPRVAVAKQRAAALDARVPRLRLDLADGSPPFTEVRCDGAVVSGAALGTELPLNPGRHTVSVSAPQRKKQTYILSLAEGDHTTLSVAPGEEVPRKRIPAPAAPGPSERTPDPFGFLLFGSGALALTGGITLLLLSTGDVDAANMARDRADSTTGAEKDANLAEMRAAVNRANTKRWVGGCTTAAGAIAAGVGLYLVLRGPKPSTAPAASLHVAPAAGGAGAMLRLHF